MQIAATYLNGIFAPLSRLTALFHAGPVPHWTEYLRDKR